VARTLPPLSTSNPSEEWPDSRANLSRWVVDQWRCGGEQFYEVVLDVRLQLAMNYYLQVRTFRATSKTNLRFFSLIN
jgi:hypothetical protein